MCRSPAAARRFAQSLGVDASAPMVLYTGTFEAYQGLDLLFAAARLVRRERPDARFVLAGGKARSGGARQSAGGRCRRRRIHLHRRAAVRERFRLSRRRRRARLAAQHRHEHAAEDLSVSALGPRHRRHAAADAHAGAVRRGGDSDRADARRLCARHPASHQRPGGGRTNRVDAAKQLADTRYTYEAYLQRTREACAALVRVNGVRPCFLRKAENHYSYAAYADPAMAASFDAKRFGGPIGQILLAGSGTRARRQFLGDVSGRRMLDMATGTGRAALALAQTRRPGHRRRCLERDAERRAARAPPTRGSPSSSRKATRTRWPSRTGAFDAVVCLRMLMHVPDWRQALSELCRVSRTPARVRLPGARQRRGAAGGLAQGARSRSGSSVEAYRVFSARRYRARARTPRLSHRRTSTNSSSCPSRFTKLSGRRPSRAASKGCLAGRRHAEAGRLARHHCSRAVRVLVTGATGFTGGHLARTLARRGYRRSGAGAPAPRRRASSKRRASNRRSARSRIVPRSRAR